MNVPIGDKHPDDVYRIKIIGVSLQRLSKVEGENHHILDYDKRVLLE